MKTIVLSIAALAALFVLSMNGGFVVTQASASDNPLVDEMVVLNEAFKAIVSAVAIGDGYRVLSALEPLHGTLERTHEGLHSGALILPKNSKNISEFVNMDDKFHNNLERLAEAARKGNKETMLLITKKLLDGCVNCHKTFK